MGGEGTLFIVNSHQTYHISNESLPHYKQLCLPQVRYREPHTLSLSPFITKLVHGVIVSCTYNVLCWHGIWLSASLPYIMITC